MKRTIRKRGRIYGREKTIHLQICTLINRGTIPPNNSGCDKREEKGSGWLIHKKKERRSRGCRRVNSSPLMSWGEGREIEER
jgi:hypothetical protein